MIPQPSKHASLIYSLHKIVVFFYQGNADKVHTDVMAKCGLLFGIRYVVIAVLCAGRVRGDSVPIHKSISHHATGPADQADYIQGAGTARCNQLFVSQIYILI